MVINNYTMKTGLGIKRKLKKIYIGIKVSNKPKIFCIGANKTGTTSIKAALKEMGFIVAPQRPAEKMIDQWPKRDFQKLIKFCKYSGEAFQDAPFSFPYTYVVLDYFFSNSKFILTIRNNAEQWYKSLTNFHAKMWGENGRIPTKKDLQNANYLYKGSPWFGNRQLFNTPEDEPYKKDVLIDYYETHNKNVIDYFRHRSKDLLIINVAKKGAYQKLASFLKINTKKTEFPWENRTNEK